MDKIVFNVNPINKDKPISVMSLLSINNKPAPVSAPVSAPVPVSAPAPAPVSAPVPVHMLMNSSVSASINAPEPIPTASSKLITELLAKNSKLQNDINIISAKYNALVLNLHKAGMMH